MKISRFFFSLKKSNVFTSRCLLRYSRSCLSVFVFFCCPPCYRIFARVLYTRSAVLSHRLSSVLSVNIRFALFTIRSHFRTSSHDQCAVSPWTGGVCCFRIELLHWGLTAGHAAESRRIWEPKGTQTAMPCGTRGCQHLGKAINVRTGIADRVSECTMQLDGGTDLVHDA